MSISDEPWLMVAAIHRQDDGPGRQGCVSLEVVGGSKTYMRIWDGENRAEWGWVLSDFNRQIWPPEDGTSEPPATSNPQQPPNGESQS